MTAIKTRTYLVLLILTLSFLRLFLWMIIENNEGSQIRHSKAIRSSFDEGAPSMPWDIGKDEIRSDRYGTNSISGDLKAGSAFCLILKDDNDILAEWVAYHYHVFNMRRLIVAVDPSSETSPSSVLKRFETTFDLNVTIWNDDDYTPHWWRNRRHDPASLNMVSYNKRGKWECDAVKIYDDKKSQTDQKENDIERCNHIFRQKIFYSECILQLQKEKMQQERQNRQNNEDKNNGVITWAVFTDTDEYLVPNPWISEYVHTKNDIRVDDLFDNGLLNFQSHDLEAMYPERPTAGSLWFFLHQYLSGVQAKNCNLCVMIPRIQFGAVELYRNDMTTSVKYSISKSKSDRKIATSTYWHHRQFETLRWKYHRDHEMKNWPKGMLNLANVGNEVKIVLKKGHDHGKDYIQYNYEIMKPNMHYPHKKCDRVLKSQIYGLHHENPNWHKQPIAHHHYLGSIERYLLRNDARRTTKFYTQQNDTSVYARGDHNQPLNSTTWATERWWIKGWFDSFLETHGNVKVYAVLGKDHSIRHETYVKTKKPSKQGTNPP